MAASQMSWSVSAPDRQAARGDDHVQSLVRGQSGREDHGDRTGRIDREDFRRQDREEGQRRPETEIAPPLRRRLPLPCNFPLCKLQAAIIAAAGLSSA